MVMCMKIPDLPACGMGNSHAQRHRVDAQKPLNGWQYQVAATSDCIYISRSIRIHRILGAMNALENLQRSQLYSRQIGLSNFSDAFENVLARLVQTRRNWRGAGAEI